MSPFMILALVIVLIILFVVVTYNKMIKLKNRVDEAWSDIDVQLKRRYNLIPNIVETVKGYATHEESVLTKVTEARSNAINATNVKEQGMMENMLSGALKSLFAVSESYPDLKANENFLQLQGELVDTEDKIQASRRFHNGVVRAFNTKVQTFPNSIIAGLFKFTDREFFEVEDEQKGNVTVDFGNNEPAETPVADAPETTEALTESPAEPTPEPVVEEKAEEVTPTPEPEVSPTPEAVASEAPAMEEIKMETPAPEAPAEDLPADEAGTTETEEVIPENTPAEKTPETSESPTETVTEEASNPESPVVEEETEEVEATPEPEVAPATEEAPTPEAPAEGKAEEVQTDVEPEVSPATETTTADLPTEQVGETPETISLNSETPAEPVAEATEDDKKEEENEGESGEDKKES